METKKPEVEKANKTAVIFGGTGLVGMQLLKILASSHYYKEVISVSRRSAGIKHRKIREIIIPFNAPVKELGSLKGDDVFVALGTTLKKAGSKEKFSAVDKDLVIEIVGWTRKNAFNQLMLVTAVGADKDSMFFYNRVKGELEEEILKFDFWSTHIFRPSLLLGHRNENRFGESIAKVIGRGIDAITGNLLTKYKPVEAEVVAQAMVAAAQRFEPGVFYHSSEKLQDLADEYYRNKELKRNQ